MKCPTCSYPLIVLEIESVEIDHCLACGGVWLDGGELELLLEGADNKRELMATLELDFDTEERSLRCPICNKVLEKARCGGDPPVRLDKCPDGDGLWFDHGELLDVIKLGKFPLDDRVYILLHEVFGDKTIA